MNNRIRRVVIATGTTTTLAGSGTRGFLDGASGIARFDGPVDAAIDPSGTFALVTVRRPPPCPRITPSRRRHTRLAHGVEGPHRFPVRPDLRFTSISSQCVVP